MPDISDSDEEVETVRDVVEIEENGTENVDVVENGRADVLKDVESDDDDLPVFGLISSEEKSSLARRECPKKPLSSSRNSIKDNATVKSAAVVCLDSAGRVEQGRDEAKNATVVCRLPANKYR